MQSHSVVIAPVDNRCRWWAKICRADQELPHPNDVHGASDLPGPYLQRGEDELLPGDVLFEGEAHHHRRFDRGWWYYMRMALPNGELLELRSGFSEQKRQLKEQGISPDLLKGSGDIAAMVRIAHGIRMGLKVTDDSEA